MNNDNYCSLGMCQKLVEAGIVLETEVVFVKLFEGHKLRRKDSFSFREEDDYIPAPTMAELWRELPTIPYLRKCCGRTEAWYNDNENVFSNKEAGARCVGFCVITQKSPGA
jgi:hypothetical protein